MVEKAKAKVNRKTCDHLATMHSTPQMINSAVYGQPSITISVIPSSMSYQISSEKDLVNMFLTEIKM